MDEIDRKLDKLDKEYPLIPHTGAGRLFSTVRRMRAEKALGVPVVRRTGFAISVKTGRRANEMTEQEWEIFYQDLSEQLRREFPELYNRVFSQE